MNSCVSEEEKVEGGGSGTVDQYGDVGVGDAAVFELERVEAREVLDFFSNVGCHPDPCRKTSISSIDEHAQGTKRSDRLMHTIPVTSHVSDEETAGGGACSRIVDQYGYVGVGDAVVFDLERVEAREVLDFFSNVDCHSNPYRKTSIHSIDAHVQDTKRGDRLMHPVPVTSPVSDEETAEGEG